MGSEAQQASKCLFMPTFLADNFDPQSRSVWPGVGDAIRVH